MKIPFMHHFQQKRLLGGALVLAGLQFGASLMGLIRDRALATTFPGLDTVDVYIAAFRPSDLLFQMTVMAGFSVALVPMLSTYHTKGKLKEMGEVLSGLTGAAALVFGFVCLLMAVCFEWIAPYMVQFKGESLELYIQFGRLALLSNFLFVFGNAFGQYLITVQKYWLYGLSPILYTLGVIGGTLFLSTPDTFGQMGPMVGTLVGSIVYVVIRGIGVFQSGSKVSLSVWHPDVPEMIKLMIPRMVALGTLQLQLLLFDTVASGLPAGSVTINAYARNFQSVAVGIAGIAIAQSAFSLLSHSIAAKDLKRFWIYMRKGIGVMLLLTIPGAILLVFVAPIAAMLVGLESHLAIFRICLAIYALSIPFESVNHLLLRGFYSAKHTITPAIFSVLNGALAIGLSWYFAPIYGVFALAIGFTAGQIMQMIGLSILLPKRVEMTIGHTSFLHRIFKRFT